MAKLGRILLTGAAGGLGTVLRPELSRLAERVRLSGIAAVPAARSEVEEVVPCDLT